MSTRYATLGLTLLFGATACTVLAGLPGLPAQPEDAAVDDIGVHSTASTTASSTRSSFSSAGSTASTSVVSTTSSSGDAGVHAVDARTGLDAHKPDAGGSHSGDASSTTGTTPETCSAGWSCCGIPVGNPGSGVCVHGVCPVGETARCGTPQDCPAAEVCCIYPASSTTSGVCVSAAVCQADMGGAELCTPPPFVGPYDCIGTSTSCELEVCSGKSVDVCSWTTACVRADSGVVLPPSPAP
jgi:hypothetical protein